MLFWLFAANTKGGHEGGDVASIYSNCADSLSDALRVVEQFPMGEQFYLQNLALFFKSIVCAMYLSDLSNGKVFGDQFYQDANGALFTGWLEFEKNNPNRIKENLAIEYLTIVANLSIFSKYPDIRSAIKKTVQFQSVRWGYVANRELSSLRDYTKIMNQALSSVSRYHRRARGVFFVPRFSKKNTGLVLIGSGVLLLGLIVRKWKK